MERETIHGLGLHGNSPDYNKTICESATLVPRLNGPYPQSRRPIFFQIALRRDNERRWLTLDLFLQTTSTDKTRLCATNPVSNPRPKGSDNVLVRRSCILHLYKWVLFARSEFPSFVSSRWWRPETVFFTIVGGWPSDRKTLKKIHHLLFVNYFVQPIFRQNGES